MRSRDLLLAIVGYGVLAAAVLACLWLLTLLPLRVGWGRELLGAAIAIVAMVVALRFAHRPRPARAPGAADAMVPAARPLASDAAPLAAVAAADPLLSVREAEVLRHLADGLSNKELARALAVSENTIKTHLANLYAKLGVSRRTEALAVARRRGLLPGR